ncbi:MAG: 23S rRNA (guanosine(2251)-2'-O)-methyltransferase RlmB [Legionellales bacterium]|nr:23S rRNA (guanosine(2251)-2'-O)-methyltransferase RlmB [Legionellales bacterium]
MPPLDEVTIGIHAVSELIERYPTSVHQLVVLKTSPNARLKHLMNAAHDHGISITHTLPNAYQHQLHTAQHQGIVALHAPIQKITSDLKSWLQQAKPSPLKILILDAVQDPRNLGACIRTACAANWDAIILPKHRSTPITETVIKVACGACAITPIFQVNNVSQTIDLLKQHNIWCWGFSEHGQQSLYDTSFIGSIAFVFGNEATGLRPLTQKRCDAVLRIPTAQTFGSLNLSVSVGIALFEANRQYVLLNS